jgi:uncharacterized protein YceH (UPF0502 family)
MTRHLVMAELLISEKEARVVAAMVEKSITTPQYYPMTVNAIMLAANQKSARHPLMALSEGDVGAALNTLEERHMVKRDSFGGRAQKWRQQLLHQLLLKPATQAVLVTLMLRGPQTAAELRANAEGLGGPKDGEGLQAALDDLADRAQSLIVQLPRAPGQAASRYAHTLCGAPESVPLEPLAAEPVTPLRASGSELLARIEALEARVASLESQLGLS